MLYEVNLAAIKKARLSKGFTMDKMAKFLGLDGKSNYYKRENGITNFKSTELPVLCDVLDLNYEKIFVKTLRKSKRKEVTA